MPQDGPQGGPRGTAKGEVFQLFKDRQTGSQKAAENQANAAIGGTGVPPRKWQLPADGAIPFANDLLDISKLHDPYFKRDDLNTRYQQCMTDLVNKATTGDVIAIKLQIDRIAVEERAFRARHATLVRCFGHAAGRRHGMGAGLGFPAVVSQAERILAAGGVS